MKTLTISLITLAIMLSGCKKDDPEKSKTELLTQNIWIHDYEMVDINQNLEPDDENGQTMEITFNFNSDGSSEYTKNQTVKYLIWNFENNESRIKITGIMDDQILPPVTEQTLTIYLLDENNLIFYYMSTATNPETGTFQIYKHE